MADENTGWCIGENGTILRSINGGTNWSSQVSGTSNLLLSSFFINSNTGWISGEDGIILSTTNSGVNRNRHRLVHSLT
ncbi:MAG: hypothetical protein IPL67_12270 [Ignavibacteria bacterium]|nr:hypothetical protein [Ignavibacteria bacterium]